MARPSKNLIENISGGLAKQLAFKIYGDKTVVTSYLDMSKVKPENANSFCFRKNL